MGENPIIDVCVEHKTKLGDGTPMPVKPCQYCDRLMCSFHLRPFLAQIPNFKNDEKKYRAEREIVEKNRGNGEGHPCFQYTKSYWEQCEKQFQPLKSQPHSIHEETNNESLEEMQGKTECKELASQESVAEPITSSSPKESKLKEFLKDLFGWR